MINIEKNDAGLYVIGNEFFSAEENTRGTRDKFWLVPGQESSYPRMLFKCNRSEKTCENWGEIIASAIASRVNVPCVTYVGASVLENGEVKTGVICESYKNNSEISELSGYSLVSAVANHIYDNSIDMFYTGELNTVDGFINCINQYAKFMECEIDANEIEQCRNDLIKQALFDFILLQADRHWLNTTFLLAKSDSKISITKSKCYDNGCICFLKRKLEGVQGISTQIKAEIRKRKQSDSLKYQLEKYIPFFGIKTTLVKFDSKTYSHNSMIPRIVSCGDPEAKEMFLEELTHEILNNPEIAHFYLGLKQKLNYSKETKTLDLSDIFQSLQTPQDIIPEGVEYLVNQIMNYQVNTIDELIKVKRAKIVQQKEIEDEEQRSV